MPANPNTDHYAWSDITGKPSTFAPSSHTHSYLPLSGGTMTGSMKFSKDSPLTFVYTAATETPVLILNGAVNYGIRYKEGTPDTLKLSASGNAQTDAADLCINGAGDGTVTIRSNVILHAGNYTSYTVTKTGSGASGSWGISVTGSAGSVAWANVTGKPSTFAPSSHTHSYLPLSGGTLTG